MIFGASVAARGWHPGSCPPPAAELVRTHSRAKVQGGVATRAPGFGYGCTCRSQSGCPFEESQENPVISVKAFYRLSCSVGCLIMCVCVFVCVL
jgi:hypothetical protein